MMTNRKLDSVQRALVALDHALNKWITLDEPPPHALYHYTDAAGFLGIVGQGTIRATHYRYLNDREEMSVGERAVEETAKELSVETQEPFHRSVLDAFIAKHRESPLTVQTHVFVASFSKHESQLSQWRAYGANGAGYSIGLRFDSKQTHGGRTNVLLCQCQYGVETFQSRLKTTFTTMIDEVARIAITEHLDEKAAKKLGTYALLRAVVVLVPALKSAAFEEENEWRLVVFPATGDFTTSDLKFRPCPRRGLVPFVEVPLAAVEKQLALERVFVGPTLDSETAKETAEMYLLSRGFTDAKNIVALTSIPYRG